MDVCILILTFVLLITKASQAKTSSSAKCSFLSPEIRSPFRIQSLQTHGVPEFNLICKQNRTVIQFPSYGELVVKSISYDTRRLNLVDPKGCVHEVFLNLDLSLTQFSYYYVVQNYKYINCSTKLVPSLEQVPCLSGSNHHVYVVEPSFKLPVSCTLVKAAAIPFPYSHYLSDSSFGLGLTWNPTRVSKKGQLEKYLTISGMVVVAIAFMVGKLLYASLTRYREESKVLKKMLGAEEIHNLLAE